MNVVVRCTGAAALALSDVVGERYAAGRGCSLGKAASCHHCEKYVAALAAALHGALRATLPRRAYTA